MARNWTFSPELLRTQRQARAYSQPRLARALGVTEAAVYSWERGEREPRLTHFLRLTVALDCRYEDLLTVITDDEAPLGASSKDERAGRDA